jgi:hypothetical protein
VRIKIVTKKRVINGVSDLDLLGQVNAYLSEYDIPLTSGVKVYLEDTGVCFTREGNLWVESSSTVTTATTTATATATTPINKEVGRKSRKPFPKHQGMRARTTEGIDTNEYMFKEGEGNPDMPDMVEETEGVDKEPVGTDKEMVERTPTIKNLNDDPYEEEKREGAEEREALTNQSISPYRELSRDQISNLMAQSGFYVPRK